jgi:hypothetical protein
MITTVTDNELRLQTENDRLKGELAEARRTIATYPCDGCEAGNRCPSCKCRAFLAAPSPAESTPRKTEMHATAVSGGAATITSLHLQTEAASRYDEPSLMGHCGGCTREKPSAVCNHSSHFPPGVVPGPAAPPDSTVKAESTGVPKGDHEWPTCANPQCAWRGQNHADACWTPAAPPDDIREPTPVPMLIHCPMCKAKHIDVGEFATKVHHTHACQGCGHVWRPAIVATVGVEFLPGFKNAPAAPQEQAGHAPKETLCSVCKDFERGGESYPRPDDRCSHCGWTLKERHDSGVKP